MASLKDVARVAKVSPMTVSNVLNGKESVNPEIRRRVENALVDVGYIYNEAARALRAGSTRVIGVLALEAVNPFYGELVAGIESEMAGSETIVMVASSHAKLSNELAALRRFAELRFQGAIITASTYSDELRGAIAALRQAGIPTVAIANERDELGLCTVSGDDLTGGLLAAEYLAGLGYRRLAYLGPSIGSTVHQRRRDGFLGGLATLGLPAPVVMDTEGDTLSDGVEGAHRLLAEASDREAVFCSNDLLALGLLQVATLRGVQVPDDLAVLGYDDIPFAAGAVVPLSSLGQSIRDMGACAMRLLKAEMNPAPDHVHEHITFLSTVRERKSTSRETTVPPGTKHRESRAGV